MPKLSRPEVREALLGAAEATILQEGYQALRARALTETAGCALGALYTVFPDMDALILVVKMRILDRLDAQILATMAATPPKTVDEAVEALLAMAKGYLDFAWDERRRWETLFQHHLADGRELPDWYQARLADIFAQIGVPLRTIFPDLPETASVRLAHVLFSAAHGIVVLGMEGKLGPVPRDEIGARIDLLVRGAIAGFRAQPDLAA